MATTKTRLEVITANPADTRRRAASLAKILPGKIIVHLTGGIGVGKTTFVQGLFAALGVLGEITSPSFALVNSFSGTKGRILVHVDCYRCEQPEEWLAAGIAEIMDQAEITVIEWPERAAGLPPADIVITLTDLAKFSRRLELHATSTLGKKIVTKYASSYA